MRLRYCERCCVFWGRRRRRSWCPKCHELLVDREPAQPWPMLRPGIRAQWDERQALDARAHPGAGADAAREAGARELERRRK